jgi:hypothetical protein
MLLFKQLTPRSKDTLKGFSLKRKNDFETVSLSFYLRYKEQYTKYDQ